jgi:hypothetical protein
LILPGFVTAGTADAEWMNVPLFLEPEHQETVHPHIRTEPVEECADEDLHGVVDIMDVSADGRLCDPGLASHCSASHLRGRMAGESDLQ